METTGIVQHLNFVRICIFIIRKLTIVAINIIYNKQNPQVQLNNFLQLDLFEYKKQHVLSMY